MFCGGSGLCVHKSDSTKLEDRCNTALGWSAFVADDPRRGRAESNYAAFIPASLYPARSVHSLAALGIVVVCLYGTKDSYVLVHSAQLRSYLVQRCL